MTLEILPDGGALITGTENELRALTAWLQVAIRLGKASPGFFTDTGLVTVKIVSETGPTNQD